MPRPHRGLKLELYQPIGCFFFLIIVKFSLLRFLILIPWWLSNVLYSYSSTVPTLHCAQIVVVPFCCRILQFLKTKTKCRHPLSSYTRQDPLLQSSTTTICAGCKATFPIYCLQELNLYVPEWIPIQLLAMDKCA